MNLQLSEQVFSHMLVVFASLQPHECAAMLSSFHAAWVSKHSSSLESRLRYIPTDCFETFPLPAPIDELEGAADNFIALRTRSLRELGVGFTEAMNLMNSPNHRSELIQELRNAQVQMDTAVARAYSWQDLDLDHGFHEVSSLPANDRVRFTINEAARLEVLRRLSALNRQRYQDEQAAAQSLQATPVEQITPRHRAGRAAVTRPTEQQQLFE